MSNQVIPGVNTDVAESTPLIVSGTSPENPLNGWRWIDTTDGTVYTWLVINDQGQWVEFGITIGGYPPMLSDMSWGV